MSITVIKEGSSLRVLEASEEIPDGTQLTLFTEQELAIQEEQAFEHVGLADWAADAADRQVDWEAFFHLEPTNP